MNIEDNGIINGGEREHFEGKKGQRLLFKVEATISCVMPPCPICKNNRKVFRSPDTYVCSEFHLIE